jgi:hypothetical protein
MKSANCYKCVYFYNTFDGSMPYGCRIFGLLSRRFPSSVIREALRHDCTLFALKSDKIPRDKGAGKRGADPDHRIDIEI